MKKRLMAALGLAMCLLASWASAQTLPSVEVFSPGLVRLSEKLGEGEPVQMRATMTATDMLYARDLSVLRSMLSGTQFVYDGWGSAAQGSDRFAIERDGETLLSLGMDRDGEAGQITVNGEVFGVDLPAYGKQIQLLDALAGTAMLERVPLLWVCEQIEALSPGDALPGGFQVTQAFVVERTMSDDGTRLTRIDIEGSIAREGETPWVIEGFLRQPAGRSPKDTFELTATQDEDNYLELSYSSLRQSEVTRKDKEGEMSVDVSFKVAGWLAGSKISSRLTVYLRNAWTADGENLKEKVTVNATLGLTDNTPGRQMQRLNDVSAKLRFVTTLTTTEAPMETIAFDEEATLSVVMDGNTFLDLAAEMTASVGGDQPAAVPVTQDSADAQQLQTALDNAIVTLVQGLYDGLSDSAKEEMEAGL